MTFVAIGIAVWLALAVVAGVFALALGRAAAIGDENRRREVLLLERSAEAHAHDRRAGADDRRGQSRPWVRTAPGRRAEDVLRRDLAEARRALADAEARLAEIEARRSA